MSQTVFIHPSQPLHIPPVFSSITLLPSCSSSITVYTALMDEGNGVVHREERRERYGKTVMQSESEEMDRREIRNEK